MTVLSLDRTMSSSALDALRAYSARAPAAAGPDAEADVQRHLQQIWDGRRAREAENEPSLAQIPRFFMPKQPAPAPAPAADSEDAARQARAQSLLHRAAASRLDEMGASVLAHGQLEELWRLLRSHTSPPHDPTDERINYDELMQVSDQMPPSAAGAFFSASHVLKFGLDAHGRIPIVHFFQWVCNKNALMSTRVELSAYDASGEGFLSEKALEQYVEDQIPKLPALASIEPRLIPYYTLTATRKILFFLDPKRRGRVAIRELLGSPILQEFLELRRADVPEDELRANWFSSQSVEDVYYTYLELDQDQNGMLCAAELAKYGEGGLTMPFVARVFQECNTFCSPASQQLEMDYKSYLEFVLAMRYTQRPEALVYFFRLLDLNGRGVLGAFEVNYFFRAVLERLIELDGEPAPCQLEDVKDEIFDMVKPAQPHGITLADLVDCKVGHTVVGILTDANAFLAYDRREFNMHEPEGGNQ